MAPSLQAIDSLPRFVVPREDLEQRLDGLRAGGLALLVASAGSGKSVLVGHWWSTRPALRVAALTLTPRHADAVVLARDLVDSLRTVAPGIDPALGDLVMRDGSTLGDPLVDGLLQALEALPDDIVVVLEDIHVLTNPALVHDVGQVVTRLPGTARAVVTTRRDLSWPVHRLRLAGRLVEVRGADMAFTVGDARTLVEGVSGRVVATPDLATLLERTDGWAVGLQLAAISLRQVPDVSAFVRSFAGSDRLVAEYLLEEVVEQQDADLRRFMFETSVLDWLSVEVCDAVTGTGNARTMLSELDARSMFLIPLDRSGERFRYHHLFSDLLRYRLRVEDPTAASELNRKAARWLLDAGREEEAIDHLLAAGDLAEAFDVISEIGHRLYERGESATLVSWLSSIEAASTEVPVAAQVSLLAAQVALDRVGTAADTYRRIVRRPELTPGARTAANALYSNLVFRDLAPETVLAITDEVRIAIPQLRSDEVVDFLGIGGVDSAQTMAEYAAAGAHFLMGDLARSAAGLIHVLNLPGVRYPVWKVYVLGSLALVKAWTGHCTEALRLADAANAFARDFQIAHHPAATHANLAAALAHLDRGEIDAAAHSLRQSRAQVDCRPASVTSLDIQQALEVRLAAVTAGPDQALELLRSPDARVTDAPVLVRDRLALQARLLIGAGYLAEARSILAGSEVMTQFASCRNDLAQLAPCQIDMALAAGDVVQARSILDAWTPHTDDLRGQVQRLLRCFVVLDAEGKPDAADAALEEAVANAHGDNLHWPFLEVPTALRALQHRGQGSALASDALWSLAVRLEPRLRAQRGLIAPLTGRELEVLTYLPGRMKNREIATNLYVTSNTLKTHLSSIYRKLGATERDQAIARATELGLI
jgi:LuxR family maltose regulon positive regulatory protein